MKQIILTAIVAIAATLTLGAQGRHTIMMGTAVNGEAHGIVLGEAVAGTVGSTSDWHVTSGQLQGIAKVNVVTSIENIAAQAEGYSVYPNPVVDVMTINRPEASAATATVSNLNGATLLSTTLTEQSSTINLSGIAPGVYILAITPQSGAKSFTAKIIKL